MYDKVVTACPAGTDTCAEFGLEEHSETVRRTAQLCKSDLVTQMVYEFPELQGTMGEKYALLSGEPAEVAWNCRTLYAAVSGDTLPETVEGKLTALADKLDILVGYFALGKIPTGSQDPFALRRQAQGVVHILLANGYALPLDKLIGIQEQYYQG